MNSLSTVSLWLMIAIPIVLAAPDHTNAGYPVHNITQGMHYSTIQAAIDASSAGNVIEVDPGEYFEHIDMSGRIITLRSTDGPETTIINGSGTDTVVQCLNTVSAGTRLEGFTIRNGYSGGNGGGMRIDGSNPTIVNCHFVDNEAYEGGGMINYYSDPTLIGCVFYDNLCVYGHGAGMNNQGSSPTLIDCQFIENRNEHSQGGAVYNDNESDPTFIGCLFRGNIAGFGSAFYSKYSYDINMINCVFVGNESSMDGGAIDCTGYSDITMVNCTVTGNTADGEGGGIHCHSGTLNLVNTILWGNTSPTGPQMYIEGISGVTVSYSCIQGGWAGTANISDDPLFVDADGPDNVYGTEDDNVNLQDGSPCVNSGNTSAIPSGIITDYEGQARVQQCRVDIGADESPFITTDCNLNGEEDACDIRDGVSEDCNNNGTPDECDFFLDNSQDCNYNLIPDVCEGDCNNNGIADECEMADDPSVDCNANGVFDACDINTGTSQDNNSNDIPDECETIWNITQDTTHSSIQQAINSSTSGDRIRVGPGTYHENINFHGKAITLRSVFGKSKSKIDGTGSGSVVKCVTGEGRTTVLDGFTVTGGHEDYKAGGGMFNNNSTPTILNCSFNNNFGKLSGGGMANWDASPLVVNCSFGGNSALHGGGGMDNTGNANPEIINCTFSGNSVMETEAAWGGALRVGNNAQIINCKFTGNNAWYGGALSISGTPDFINCTFVNNTAYMYAQTVIAHSSSPNMTNCILWGSSDQIVEEGSASMQVTYSCIQGGFEGTGNISANPTFGSGYSLAAGSPCIDAGNNTPLTVDYDITFGPRRFDDVATLDTGLGTPPIVDMGAYEYCNLTGDLTGDCSIDEDDVAVLISCMSGVGVEVVANQCDVTDLDGDTDVDLADYAILQQAFTSQ